jgi:NAD(P)-dependent dehydrogenase (short-subunit alcohol dehydrogenase family)
MTSHSLKDATALVVGADTTLGKAMVANLFAAGARVAAHCLDATAQVPGAELHISANVLDEEALRTAFEHIENSFGQLNLLILCHAQPQVGGLLEQSLDDFWQHQDQQLSGSFLISQLATPLLKAAGWGRVVLLSSGWSAGAPGLAAVATAAGGVQVLCKTLARELGPHGITVNALAHAFTDSEWLACDASALGMSEAQVRNQAAVLVPAGQLGTPAQVAASALLLCQPVLGAAVAQTLQCSGGYFRRRT